MPLSDFYPELKGWQPAQGPAASPAPSLGVSDYLPNAGPSINPYLRTTLPLVLQYQPDTLKQYNRPGLSSYRTTPLAPNASSAHTAASASTSKIVSQTITEQIIQAQAPIPVFGASGVTHSTGVVPDPGSVAGTSHFLREDATWAIPTFADTDFYQTVQQAGISKPQEAKLNFTSPITVADNPGNSSSDITVPVFGASGGSHSTGLVPDPGSSAGTSRFLREDATWQAPPSAPPAILAYSVTTESSDTALSASTLTTVITKAVTMPSSGCPCRVDARWAQYMVTTGSSAVAEALVSDGTNNFAEAEWPIDVNNGPSGTGSGYSPVTYSNSANVTFTLKIQVDAGSSTAKAAPFHAFGGRNSRLELAIFASN